MPTIQPYIPTRAERHATATWTRDECYRFYVQQRRLNCTFRERMDLWLRAPWCDQCIQSDPLFSGGPPDIMRETWEADLAWSTGEDMLEIIQKARAKDPDFTLRCRRCHGALSPWDGDDVYVQSEHLEEHYSIPMETPGRTAVSERLRRKIVNLYDRACFSCGATTDLTIDHILPQSAGGDAAFRNLQPLCGTCNRAKGDGLPEDVVVYSDMYFGPEPSDGYEGLFW